LTLTGHSLTTSELVWFGSHVTGLLVRRRRHRCPRRARFNPWVTLQVCAWLVWSGKLGLVSKAPTAGAVRRWRTDSIGPNSRRLRGASRGGKGRLRVPPFALGLKEGVGSSSQPALLAARKLRRAASARGHYSCGLRLKGLCRKRHNG
jgi:hypothetical protein